MISTLRPKYFIKILIALSVFLLSYSLLYAQTDANKNIYKDTAQSPQVLEINPAIQKKFDIDVSIYLNFRRNRSPQQNQFQNFEYTNYTGDPIRFRQSASLEYWVKIQRTDYTSLDNHLIVLKPNTLHEVDLFIPEIIATKPLESRKPNTIDTVTKYSKRAYLFALPDTITYDTIYLRIKAKNNTKFDVELWNADEYYKEDKRYNSLLSMLFGVLLLSIVINLLFFIALRQNKYILYCAYILGLLIVLASASGKIYEYTIAGVLATSSNKIILLKAVTALFLTLLIQNLANLKNTSTELFKLSEGIKLFFALIIGLCLVLSPLPILVVTIFNFSINLFILLCISISLLSWNSEKYEIRYIFYSVIPIIIGLIISSLAGIDSLPNNIYTQMALQVGFVVHSLIIAYGLSSNIFDINKQLLKAQENNRQHTLSLEIEKQHADLINHVKSYIRFNPGADQEHEIVTRFFDQLRPIYDFEKAALIYQIDSKLQVKTDFKKYQPHFADFVNKNLIDITRLCHGNQISEIKPKNMTAHFDKNTKFLVIPVFLRGQEWSGMLINLHNSQAYTESKKDSLHRYATEVMRSLLNTQMMNNIRAELKEDPVSKLLNRAAIFEELDLLIKDTQYSNKPSSVALLKVSDYININQEHGQEIAYTLLRYVGDHLRSFFDEKVLLGRTANADFLLLFSETYAKEASKLLTKMRDQLKPMAVKDMQIDIKTNIAVAQCHGAFETARDLMRRVDKGIQETQETLSDVIYVQE